MGARWSDSYPSVGNPTAARQLAELRERHGSVPPRLGCSLVAHRDLGFCAACHERGQVGELIAWQLLAMAERGIPDQPGGAS